MSIYLLLFNPCEATANVAIFQDFSVKNSVYPYNILSALRKEIIKVFYRPKIVGSWSQVFNKVPLL